MRRRLHLFFVWMAAPFQGPRACGCGWCRAVSEREGASDG